MGKSIKPIYRDGRPGDVRDSQADASLAAEKLNWRPKVTFEEGLCQTVAWFQQEDV